MIPNFLNFISYGYIKGCYLPTSLIYRKVCESFNNKLISLKIFWYPFYVQQFNFLSISKWKLCLNNISLPPDYLQNCTMETFLKNPKGKRALWMSCSVATTYPSRGARGNILFPKLNKDAWGFSLALHFGTGVRSVFIFRMLDFYLFMSLGEYQDTSFLGDPHIAFSCRLRCSFDLTFESGRNVNSSISSWAAMSASPMPSFALSLMAYSLDVLKQYSEQMCLFEFFFKISQLLVLSELG